VRDPARMQARVECEHGDRCGGCPLLALDYAEQLTRKHARVEAAFSRYALAEETTIAPVAAAEPIVGYRTRAKLIVGPDGAIGLFAAGGGHRVVDIPGCRVLSPALARVAKELRGRVRDAATSAATTGAPGRSPLAPFDPEGAGSLRAVDLREVREEGSKPRVLVTFVVERSRVDGVASLEQAARALMEAAPEVIGVAANFHEGDAPQILGSQTVRLAGVDRAPDRVGASVHLATFGSFVQAHRGQTGRVHALLAGAVRLAGKEANVPRVLDLYGGSGSIGLALAAAGARVVLVESFAPAVEQAAAAARAQRLDLEARCADAASALGAMAARGERFDAIVVNPPRRGVSPRTREGIASLEPEVVAYVSCDPDTLARDLADFGRLGYAPRSLQPLDMIPLTDEVETIAVLRRGGVPAPPIVYEDGEIIVVDKAPHEPTLPQGEYRSSLRERVRRIVGAEEAVPVHPLDVDASGLVMFARHPANVARWQRALGAEGTRATHVAAVRGVTSAKGRIAEVRYRRFAIASGHALLRVVETPFDARRARRLRQPLARIEHPVLGDTRHGHAPTNRYFEEKCGLDRAFLHFARLEMVHPDTGNRAVFEAPLAGDLASVLERMGFAGSPAPDAD
jgi:23S rRNA (uracil1939-C5)-methyltransferase